MKTLILVIFSFLLCSCTTLRTLKNDFKEISTEATQVIQEPMNNIILPFIPQPYQIPASLVVGYIVALLRRKYKKLQGAKQ